MANKSLNPAKNLRKKSNAILEFRKKTPKRILSAIARQEKKKPIYTENQITRKKKSEMNTATNLSRKARNINITPRTKKELIHAKLRHNMQQAKRKSFKGPKKMHQRGPSKLRIVKTANNIARNKNKTHNAAKKHNAAKTRNANNLNLSSYNMVNNANEAKAAPAPNNSQESVINSVTKQFSNTFSWGRNKLGLGKSKKNSKK